MLQAMFWVQFAATPAVYVHGKIEIRPPPPEDRHHHYHHLLSRQNWDWVPFRRRARRLTGERDLVEAELFRKEKI
ncbi:hypothetical protein LWI28_001720 [Acer negundo]|uniref:Uncharacterized protein n=1 Tax=Acer negundo TaxID=4023 RepID=A0AAD5I8Q2_ACENE|nr:hypothetical protein LWI28_001720 [Acer negundo]